VLPELERRFTVYAMDRRGRGGSGDSPAYDLQREAEDVAAVVDSIDEPVAVLGHSYGGLCAIESAILTLNLRRLILYEAVPLRGADGYKPGVIERLESMLVSGDIEGMLIATLREVVEMPQHEIELLRAQRDAWAVRLGNARTLPRELESEAQYIFAPERFRNMRTPTLLVVGGESPPREMQNARGVAEALPHAKVVALPGQQHVAMHTAPELFVREVVRFLDQ
jgi:pimeloyl-ACP methyl ester carboxylesterase